MEIKILGPGCPKCEQLAKNTQEAIKAAGLDVEVTKVKDMKTIASYGVMMTPALVVDGEVKAVGKVLKPDQIKKFLQP
jgi:small redox-active disulfide protein 2